MVMQGAGSSDQRAVLGRYRHWPANIALAILVVLCVALINTAAMTEGAGLGLPVNPLFVVIGVVGAVRSIRRARPTRPSMSTTLRWSSPDASIQHRACDDS